MHVECTIIVIDIDRIIITTTAGMDDMETQPMMLAPSDNGVPLASTPPSKDLPVTDKAPAVSTEDVKASVAARLHSSKHA